MTLQEIKEFAMEHNVLISELNYINGELVK